MHVDHVRLSVDYFVLTFSTSSNKQCTLNSFNQKIHDCKWFNNGINHVLPIFVRFALLASKFNFSSTYILKYNDNYD